MVADLDLYRDREHSFIKHQFLTQYLRSAAYKTLQGRSPTFNFVDAFAGPWRVSDDAKYSDASFDQAINTLEAVRSDLANRGIDGLKMRFCLCERRPDAAARLRSYAAQKQNFEIYIFEGEFENNLASIASELRDGFTFTFIDPTGWNIRNDKVFRFLREQRGEFMLNFMSDHINRHAGYNEVSESFGRFLADSEWSSDFARLPGDWTNEQRMLHLIKTAMRRNKIATYLPDFSIMLPRFERLKMRLIFGTHNPHGLQLFRDVQQKVEIQEMEIRNSLREGENPQVNLFSSEYIAEIQQQQKGVGGKANRERAQSIIMKYLEENPNALAGSVINVAMERIAIRKTQINTLLIDMRKRGIIIFDLPPRKKVPQDNTRINLP